MKTLHVTCEECGNIVIPQWNPYDGFWECPVCWEELNNEEIDGYGPTTADFNHTNRNPDI